MTNTTPRTRVKGMLRQIFLKSCERAAALKRDGYTCQGCGSKQSVKKGCECKVQVHHKLGIEWDNIIDLIYQQILCDVAQLETLCISCHNKKSLD